jgi:hypothetical protein
MSTPRCVKFISFGLLLNTNEILGAHPKKVLPTFEWVCTMLIVSICQISRKNAYSVRFVQLIRLGNSDATKKKYNFISSAAIAVAMSAEMLHICFHCFFLWGKPHIIH